MDGVEYFEVSVSPPKDEVAIKVYRRRWVVLAVFTYYSMLNSIHWVQYVIVGDLVARYYGITVANVELTSYVYLGSLVVLMLPACFVMDKMGMRWSLMQGGFLMMAGSWFKVVAVSPDRFVLVLVGQVAVGIAQIFMLGTPAKVAAIWFPADELSTACAIAVFGNQLGLGIGSLVPPIIVRQHDDPQDIGYDLNLMTYLMAANSTLVAVLVVLLFQKRPELPPSRMQALERSFPIPVTMKTFAKEIRSLLSNKNYQFIVASSAIANGALNAFVTVLNPIILIHFPNEQAFAGRVGFIIILAGTFGCIVFGILLDKTHKYKEFMLGAYALMAMATGVFGFVLETENPVYVYLSAGVLGLFLAGFLPLSFEMAAEVTYPYSESTMGSIMFIPSCALGILMAVVTLEILQRWGDLLANLFLCASLLLGTVLATFVQKDYRRLAATSGRTEGAAPDRQDEK